MRRAVLPAVLILTVLSSIARSDEKTPQDSPPEAPVVLWDFEKNSFAGQMTVPNAEDFAPLAVRGQPSTVPDGPQPPEFPGLSAGNAALSLDGKSWLEHSDAPVFHFAAGDSISLEAWVRLSELNDGQQVYVVGKGRTSRPGTVKENQSWALRVRSMGGQCRISFLFRSADAAAVTGADGKEVTPAYTGELHRWNSDLGFDPDGQWHHLAVTYTFGDKQGPIGWIDGQPTDGSFDLGGKTFSRAPYSDDDQVWVGSSMGGNPGSSFRGSLDGIAVYRRKVTDAEIQQRTKSTRPTSVIPEVASSEIPSGAVALDIRENVRQNDPWNRERTRLTMAWQQPAAALTTLPRKYIEGGLIGDRTNPCVLRMRLNLNTAAVKTQFLIRSRSTARLLIDGKEVAKLIQPPYSSDGHQEVPVPPEPLYPTMHPVPAGDQEAVAEVSLEAGRHLIEFETIVGGRNMRVEASETLVAMGSPQTGFEILSSTDASYRMDEASWQSFAADYLQFIAHLNASERRNRGADATAWWEKRHQSVREILGPDAAQFQPADVDRLLLDVLSKKKLTPLPLVDDLTFLRRLALNTVGVIPSPEEQRWFLAQPAETRRAAAVDRFLADDRWADHWVSYWQDVLAENPGILKPELNNSGPFRWWIYESFLDNKPTDRFATELIQMKGSRLGGGPAGFGMASQNDVPLAERSIVLSTAFSARNMTCARCHDSPVNEMSQSQLFAMAAMINRSGITIPGTSSVPKGPNGERSKLIRVSIEPGQSVEPAWPFSSDGGAADASLWQSLLQNPGDSREQLALHLTHPTQSQFAAVMVNRLWARFFGQGLMSNVDDWYAVQSDHQALLTALAQHHMAHGYDLKATAKLLLLTEAFQRQAAPADAPVAENFGAVTLRRMTAEQLLDSLYVAAGKSFDAEMLTLDPEGRRPDDSFLNLGTPRRAWQFCSLSNERDRPALALPVAQSLVDLLNAYGWRDSRPHSTSARDDQATVLQPLTLANGNAGHRLVQLSDNGAPTELAIKATSPEEFVDRLFERLLTRQPTAEERELFAAELAPGFAERVVPGAQKRPLEVRRNAVSWSNHLNAEATRQKQLQEEAARLGDPPTERLAESWRLVAEDVLWAVMNSPEFAFVP
ncbi:MAG: DUF1553 domain-containing protein [Planctomycetaceae bacterium]